MRSAILRISSVLIGLVLALAGTTPALADDSEVFTSTAFLVQNSVRPNILFIIDTSGSMDTSEDNYDPKTTFTGPCRAGALYFKLLPRGGFDDTPPDCKNSPDVAYINVAANTCSASKTLLDSTGVFTSKFQQFVAADKKWGAVADKKPDNYIECVNDDKKHGQTDASSKKRAANVTGGWDASAVINWNDNNVRNYTLYTSNYANWYFGTDKGSRTSRLDIVRTAADGLVDTLQGVNLGIARYDSDAQGGMITEPVLQLDDAQRTKIKATLKSYEPAGNTPLSETLYEAGLYFAGLPVEYGLKSAPVSSVAAARTGANASDGLPANYKSPMQYSCQKNYIVYLTDGLPTSDTDADSKIPKFDPPGNDSKGVDNSFNKVMGVSSCSINTDSSGKKSDDQNGACLDDMAGYLNKVDMRGDLYGLQNVSTFVIGFGEDVKSSVDYLNKTAEAGGSNHAYTASNSSALTTTLQDIFSKVADDANLTFTSPTVSVNAFNRAQNLNDLYVSVFSPNQTLHWDGNLKKYQLVDGTIYGQDPKGGTDAVAAVNPETGFFFEDAKSYWSTVTDGLDVTKGGAASKLPDFADDKRVLVTYLGASKTLTDASNAIKDGNTANLTNTLLGVANDTVRKNVIAFARGEDVTDTDGDDDFTENNHQMGDPMHARPAVVIYGGTTASPDVNDAIAYVPTNDGYLHAVDTKTGVEKWAFVPKDFLPRLQERYDNPAISTQRSYALDGDVRVFKYDVNRDGIVTYSAGDRVYIYFGTGRGSPSSYYALDVSQPGTPKFMWQKTSTNLPGLADAWSTPVISRVDVKDATQNTNKYVLIFGGGYDSADQESYVYKTDVAGNRIFMLDAISGDLLWSAGPSASSANLKLAKMTHSIPAGLTVIDNDANGFADRMYAADMGGRVWRFDIANGKGPTDLVAGGVFASLGAAEQSPAVREDTRRFYYAPDVALFAPRGAKPFYNLAIGSGYRGHPLEEDTHDRFYALRDYAPFTPISQTNYDLDSRKYILDGDLVDVTTSVDVTVPDGSAGWKLELRSKDKWLGEKVLAEAITVNGVILFPTFQPNGQNTDNPCLPATLNRVYAVTADNARPFVDNNHDGDKLDLEDRSTSLKQGGIAAGISVIVDNSPPDPTKKCEKGQPNCNCDKDGKNCKYEPPESTCLAGVEILKTCVPFKDAVRTFWNRK